MISIEDRRFYSNEGIDLRSLGRAVLHDVLGGGGIEGASTIEEEFVKNALQAQSKRTIFEKIERQRWRSISTTAGARKRSSPST